MTTLEIFSPVDGKGLGKRPDPRGFDRGYKAYDWDTWNSSPHISDKERPKGFKFPDESNYIVLGLTIKNDQGIYLKDETVVVDATDNSQNKTIVGTGSKYKTLRNANVGKTEVFYYPYTYQFKRPGAHKIKFTWNGQLAEVNIVITNPQ